MSRPSLSELTAFIAIAKQRSFRVAALELGSSPSALSHMMKSLEGRLGVRLLNRTTRSVGLTEAGEHLLLRAAPALTDLDEAITEVITERNRPSGSIRISTAEAGAKPLIRHVLPDFLAKYPDIHVEFVIDTRFVDIVSDRFDAGIRLHGQVPQDMVAIEFGPKMRLAAVASPEYVEQHGTPATPEDLKRHRCIRFRFSSGALNHWDLKRDEQTTTVDANGPMTLENTNLMTEAALAGIGIAWVPQYQFEPHLKTGRLVQLLPEWSPTLSAFSLYYPANRHPPTALRLLTEAVRDWARQVSPSK